MIPLHKYSTYARTQMPESGINIFNHKMLELENHHKHYLIPLTYVLKAKHAVKQKYRTINNRPEIL